MEKHPKRRPNATNLGIKEFDNFELFWQKNKLFKDIWSRHNPFAHLDEYLQEFNDKIP